MTQRTVALQIVTQLEAAGAQMVAVTLHRALAKAEPNGAEQPISIETKFIYYKQPLEDRTRDDCLMPHRPKLSELFKFVRLLRRMLNSPDVIIAHTHYAAPIARLFSKRPVIAVHHGPRNTWPLSAQILDHVVSLCGGYAREVCVSTPVASSIKPHRRSRRAPRIRVIDNPLPDSVAATHEPPISPPTKITKSPASRTIVMVGRLVEQKNHELAIRALAQSRLDNRLKIFGSGPLRSNLTKLATDLGVSDRLQIIDPVSHDQLIPHILSSDLFLSTSIWEAAPVSLLEAMKLHKSILASDIDSHRYTLGHSAQYFPLSREQDLVRLLNAPRLRPDAITIANNLRRFDPQTAASRYLELIRAVVAVSDHETKDD